MKQTRTTQAYLRILKKTRRYASNADNVLRGAWAVGDQRANWNEQRTDGERKPLRTKKTNILYINIQKKRMPLWIKRHEILCWRGEVLRRE